MEFRNKYHPIESLAYQKKINVAVRKRAKVFLDLVQSGWLERFSLTMEQGEDIAKLLDAAVIKFEGGSDFDLKVLSDPGEQEIKVESGSKDGSQPAKDRQDEKEKSQQMDTAPVSPSSVPLPETPAPPSASLKGSGFKAETIKPLELSDPSPEQLKLREEAAKYHQQQLQQQKQEEEQKQQPNIAQEQGQKPKLKRKRRHREPYYYDENGESDSETESEVESEPAPPGEESTPNDAQERAAEETLLPPGVDTEPVSSDEITVGGQGGAAEGPAEGRTEAQETKTQEDVSGDRSLGGDEEKATSGTNNQPDVPVSVDSRKSSTSDVDQSAVVQEQNSGEVGDADEKDDTEKKPEDTKMPEKTTELSPAEAKPEETTKETTDTRKGEANQGNEETKMDTSENADTATKTDSAKEHETDGAKPEAAEVLSPRALHRTLSLFVRNVPPKISHDDIVSVCGGFPGFMRVVLSDPSPERKFSRRGWITFKPDVNIKDICWAINNIKIREVELNPIVNRELARRVRMVSGAAVLKEIVKTDMRMAARLIQRLDEKFEVWTQSEEEPLGSEGESAMKIEEDGSSETADANKEEKPQESTDAVTASPEEETKSGQNEIIMEADEKIPKTNPILVSLPADIAAEKKEETATKTGDEEGQIVEEGQVADDGQEAPAVKTPYRPAPVVDLDLVNSLDRLLLYLRIVHSLDYYSGAEYLYEDDMPNRCGIVHIRSPLPDKVNYEEVTEWHKNLHQKLEQHLQKKETLKEDEATELGKKDQDQEVEKFVQANTQELAKDKWLCPLSGKKFRGPEFVRKHIFNKHMEKVQDVKTEVAFFNNFVFDPKRPSEPEVKANSQTTTGSQPFPAGVSPHMGMQGNMGWGRGVGMMHQGGRGGFHSSQISPNYRSTPDHYGNRGQQSYQSKPRRGQGMRRDPRPLVQYKDLDAPGDECEFF